MYKEREIERDGKRKRKTVKGGRENESKAHTLIIYIYSKAHTLIIYIYSKAHTLIIYIYSKAHTLIIYKYVHKSGICRKAYRDV